MTALWIAFLAVLAAGALFVAANSLEAGYSRASVPQILYFLYLMAVVLSLAVGQRAHLAGLLFFVVAVAATGWLWHSPPRDAGLRRRAISDELAKFRAQARGEARNPLAWETVGDIYAALGETALALRNYDEAARLYSASKVARQELFDKMKRMRTPAMAPGPDAELGACRACGIVVGRLERQCAGCGCVLVESRALYLAARFNRVFAGSKLDRVTAAGIVMLPFLFLLGPEHYAAAWGIWTAGLATWRTGVRQGIV